MKQPDKPVRHSTRLRDFDYAQAGAYFITICSYQRESLFGEIVAGIVRLNEVGRVIAHEWQKTAEIRANVIIDEFVVMPNHFHGIIFINDIDRATRRVAPTTLASGSLGAIIAQFKSSVTRQLKRTGHHPGTTLWQRNYHDHVIRNDEGLWQIRNYVMNNPLQWALDRNHPDNIQTHPTP